MSSQEQKAEQLCGFIERITFQNAENGYTVAHLQDPNRTGTCCIVGILPSIQPGETIRCFGSWKNHLVHGRQFEIKEFRSEIPADITSIKKYLGSGLVKGIGAAYANRIVDAFGTETLNIIDQHPEKLKKVPGLGKKRIDSIIECWSDQRSIRDVMIFLQSQGITPAYAQKIFKIHGNQSIAKVKDNPYSLARDITGIGFKTADSIAQKMGIPKDSAKRIDAGIEHLLYELSNDGHVCFPHYEFLAAAQPVLEVPPELIIQRIEALQKEDRVEVFELIHENEKKPFVWLKQLFYSEIGIAREIKRLQKAPCHLRDVDIDKALVWVQDKLKIELAAQQQEAIRCALKDKVQIITGGPGTGKSTITKAILAITEKLTGKIILAAPTGRAAKRMSEITGKRAYTIHSLLEFSPKGGFKKNKQNPIDCDLIIIDEASMIDTFLMYSLLRAIPPQARVIFVGDINQLPSVGPGNVLRDLINSKQIPVTTLTEIFRQAAGSRIITNAHRINKGQFPDLDMQQNSDFFFVEAEEHEDVLKNIISLVSQRLPKKYNFHPLHDIQVLAPMKRGVIGIENLNVQLQQIINPKDHQPLFRGGQKFMAGDKVMQMRNDYKKEVFNGDVGYITKVDMSDQSLIINFDGRDVVYEISDLDELSLAYAVSIHKYQGSECPCIVMPIHTSHFMMLHRNLLYTGVTRGKKLVVLVGSKRAIAIAVNTDDVRKRYTGLQQALLGTL